jgi:hypothetical protein
MSLLGRVSASGTAMRDAKRELLQKRGISESKRSVLAFEGGDGPALKRVTAAAAPIRELREKLAPDVLKRTLLSLFTLERPCWTMTELAAETKQPREHLSQMLQQICTTRARTASRLSSSQSTAPKLRPRCGVSATRGTGGSGCQ